MIASGFGFIFIKYLGQKNTLVIGQVVVTISLFAIVGSFYADAPIGIIIFNGIFVVAFQSSLGPIGYNHPVETCLPFTIGPLNAFLFANNFITSMLGPLLMSSLGPAGTFIFFGSISFFFNNLFA